MIRACFPLCKKQLQERMTAFSSLRATEVEDNSGILGVGETLVACYGNTPIDPVKRNVIKRTWF